MRVALLTVFVCALSARALVPVERVDLVANGGFESVTAGHLPAGWSVRTPDVPGVTLARAQGDGGWCVTTRSTYAEDRPWFWWQQRVGGVQPGGIYRLAARTRSEGLTHGAIVGLTWLDGDGRMIRREHLSVAHDRPKAWAEVAERYTAPAGAAAADVILSMHGAGQTWWDDVRLEWSPEPERVDLGAARVYPVRPATRTIALDGRNEDWESVPRSAVRSAVAVSDAQAVVEDAVRWGGPDDLSLNLAAQHDAERLYLLISVRDDVRRTRRPFWQGDSVQLALDTGYRRAAGFGPGDYALDIALPPAGGGTPDVLIGRAPDGSVLQPGDVGVGYLESEGWYLLELALPWDRLGIEPRHNLPLGFTVVVNDDDGAGRKWLEWTPGLARGKRPAEFGTLLLLRDGALGLLAEVPGEPVPDTRALPLAATLINVGDAPAEAELRVSVGDGVDQRRVVAEPGVTRLPLLYAAGSVPPGTHAVTIAAGELTGRGQVVIEPVQAVVEAARQRLDALAPRIDLLRERVERGRAQGLDVALPDVTLATAELFQAWIPLDLQREGHHTLAQREVERLAPRVEQALAEIDAILAAPARHPAIAPPDALAAELRDGGWWVGQRPLLLIGMNQVDREMLPMLKRLGGNLDGIGASAHWLAPTPAGIDGERLAAYAADVAENAALGLRSDILFGQRLPDWFVEQHPEATAAEGHFFFYDIDHPAARELTATVMREVAAAVSAQPGMSSIDLWNEAAYERVSPLGLAKFRAAMAGRYVTIAALNAAWGTSFASFDALTVPERDPSKPAAYADWCRWNDSRVTDWLVTMDAAVKAGAPGMPTHVKVGNEITLMGSKQLNGGQRSVSGHYHGLDRWAIAHGLDIHGCDTRPTMLSDEYAFQWVYPGMAFDLQRSLAPDKPIFDSEWHGVQTVFYTNPDIPAEHLDASLWHSYLHGMDANLTWWWSRHASGEPRAEWFEGSLMTQPQLVDTWGRNSVIVQRLAPEIVAFQQQAAPVRLLYSKPSAILDTAHLDTLRACYERLALLDTPVGFVTEEMLLAAEGGADWRLIVVPAARHASPGVREALARLQAAGARVVTVGNGVLTLDPHGRPLPDPAPLPADVLGPEATRAEWDKLVEAAGIARPVRGRTGGAVECRTALLDGRRLVYLLGLGKQPASVALTVGGQPLQGRSLLSGRPVGPEITLGAWGVELLEVVE